MKTIVFATNNKNKISEVNKIKPEQLTILSLVEAGIDIDIPEPFDTIWENAVTKAKTIFEITGKPCFAEDSGLEVMALNNEPGVLSARYAGEPKSDQANIEKLLKNMEHITDRKAQFKTVIAYYDINGYHLFEGVCLGSISFQSNGNNGFGYDPIFIPEGYSESFGELSINIKLSISHRTKAFNNFALFLSKI
jgi:XTP/dITP diphosphohydrolase